MRQAFALSAHGLGTTSPNPPVGCVLADEARLVLGPWLTAQTRGWPFVVAGYAVGSDGPQHLEPDAVSDLQAGVDAVLYQDGRVEEAIPGRHGQGVLNIPPVVATAE